MKQRYSSLDLQVIASELSVALPGTRLTNLYDITPRIFLLKFSRSTPPNPRKHLVLLDSGFRVHITNYSRATATTPSGFVVRLRKWLRGKRCVSVRQVGGDRVLELAFGEGGRWRLVLEFYAGGNVVLVDMEGGGGGGFGSGLTSAEPGLAVAVFRTVTKDEAGGRGETKAGVKYQWPEEGGRRVDAWVFGEDHGAVSREKVMEVLKDGVESTKKEAAAKVKGEDGHGDGADKVGGEGKKPMRKRFKKKKEDAETVGGTGNTTPTTSVKKLLALKVPEFSPVLVEHVLLLVGLDPTITAEEALVDDSKLEGVVRAIGEARSLIKSFTTRDVEKEGPLKGYIISKEYKPRVDSSKKPRTKKAGASGEDGEKDITALIEDIEVEDEPLPEELKRDSDGYVYDDFHPFLPIQFANNKPGIKVIEVEGGFNNTVDTFFSSLESQKLTTRIQDRKIAAMKKLTSARSDHLARVTALQNSQTLNQRKARTIERNLELVEEAVRAVNGLREKGMDWEVIGKMIEREKKRGNEIASIIEKVWLEQNKITISLEEEGEGEEGEVSEDESEEEEDSEDDDNGTKKGKGGKEKLKIDIDLSLSGYANARLYYTEKKNLAAKEEKTIQSSSKALKNTERKVLTDLKKGLNKEKQLLRPVRAQCWWEKFFWFVSSEGYLVVGARDIQQSELLYQRYFRRGDIWVSADIEGAPILVIKNHKTTPNAPIPPSTLSQAGTFVVCASKAWETKAVMSAWWVGWDSVGKLVKETGEYLEAGRFVVQDKGKIFLPPAQLQLGWGVLWVLGDVGEAVQAAEAVLTGGAEKKEGVSEGKEADVEEGRGQEEGEQEEQQEKEEEEEESDDEEFPDVQIESADESEAEQAKEEVRGANASEQQEENSTPAAEIVDTVLEGNANPDAAEPARSGDEDGIKPTLIINNLPTTPPLGKKRLSAKERRDLKKHGGAANISGTSTPLPTPTAPSPSPSPSPGTPSSSHTPAPRGKKHKFKKADKKYALQSDEERDLARNLLGISHSSQANPSSPSPSTSTQEQEKKPREAADVERERKREAYLRAQAAMKAAEEKRQRRDLPKDEGPNKGGAAAADDGDDDEEDDIVNLSHFTPNPAPGIAPKIIDAIPVCAPLPALAKYKYKIKFLPGTAKKSKAIRETIYGWVKMGEPAGKGISGVSSAGKRGIGAGLVGWDESPEGREREFMWKKEWEVLGRWRSDEGVNQVPVGKVKVVGGFGEGGGGGKVTGGKGGGKEKAEKVGKEKGGKEAGGKGAKSGKGGKKK